MAVGCGAQLGETSPVGTRETDPGRTLGPIATQLNAPDLTGETIALYHLCGRAGPLAEFNQTKIFAVQDMVSTINDSGGIFGAQLVLEFVDTGGSENAARSAYDRIRRLNDDIPLLLLCDANTELTLAPYLGEGQIPALSPGYAPLELYQAKDSYLFAFNIPIEAQFAYFVEYVNHNWGEIGPPGSNKAAQWALLAWPVEEGGQLMDMEWIESLGVELVFHKTLAVRNQPDLFDSIYEARDENVNLFYVTARGELPAALLDALGALGLKDRVLVAGPSFSFESDLSPFLFDSANAKSTMFTSSTPQWTDVSNPELAHTYEIFVGSQRELESQDAAYLGMLGAVDIARKAIESAILDAGFEQLNAEAVFEALSALNNYEVLGGLYSVDYGSGDHFPQFLQLNVFGETAEEHSVVQPFSPIPTLTN